jgi:hypothetical protein
LGVFVFCSKLRDTDISYLNIFYAFIKNTVLAGFTIFPATIAYIVVNDQVIVDFYNMLNQSLLVTLEAITLKPKTDTQMDELIIIMVTTVVAMIFWMFSIYFIHKEFLSKYVNIRFLKR